MGNTIKVIDNDKALNELIAYIHEKKIRELALDFEGEFYLHKYGIHLGLMQMFDGRTCYIIDPLKISNQRKLADITENEDILKVMFAAGTDLSLLQNSIGITITSLFDLSLAAKSLEIKGLSLSSVLEKFFGIKMEQKNKFQKANWLKRPLKDDMIEYAAGDVLHLLELKKILTQRMFDSGKLDDFLIKNNKLQNADYIIDMSSRYLKIKGAYSLNDIELIYLKHFFNTREDIAKKLDVPPGIIISNKDLISFSRVPPDKAFIWKKHTVARRVMEKVDFSRFINARKAAFDEINS